MQTAQRKKLILNPNDPVQIRHSKNCEDVTGITGISPINRTDTPNQEEKNEF